MNRTRAARTSLPRRPARWTPPPPSATDLARELRDVVADLPRFLTAPLLRRWHRTWGATRDEVAAAMPGDHVLPRAHYRCTRAITIAATPEEVWPWLVQVGCRRAGWYADDLLDNFTFPSAREIVPELQDLAIGQLLPMVPSWWERLSFVVDSYDRPRWLLWRTPSRTWAWRLDPLADGRTRLVTRLRTVYERRPGTLVVVLLMEFGDFPMMRRMLIGLRERAESEHRRRAPQPGTPPRRGAAPARTPIRARWSSPGSRAGTEAGPGHRPSRPPPGSSAAGSSWQGGGRHADGKGRCDS